MFRVEHGNENSEKYFYKEFDDYDEAYEYAKDADDYNEAYVDVFDDDGYEDDEYNESIKSYRGVPIIEMGKPSKPASVHYDYTASCDNIAFTIDLYNNNIKSKNINGAIEEIDTLYNCIKMDLEDPLKVDKNRIKTFYKSNILNKLHIDDTLLLKNQKLNRYINDIQAMLN